MQCKLTNDEILELVDRQLSAIWGGNCSVGKNDIAELEKAVKRLEISCTRCNSPYFHENGHTVFKIEHTVQYTLFLYLLANEFYKSNKVEKASFVYYLNKVMNGVDWFYAIDLPEIFFAEHPISSVLGRATYNNYFFIYQGVTVGGNITNGKIYYPTIGNYVTMFSDSKIVGKSCIGNHVIIGANTYIKDMDIPDYSIVFGQYPDVVIKPVAKEKIDGIIGNMWM